MINERHKPEGKVRLFWIKKLINEYGFPSSHIDINVPAGVGRDAGKSNIPVRADIVVYRNPVKTQPMIVIETKAYNKKDGLAQAESYSRNLGSEYHIWSDGHYTSYFKTAKYANLSESIGNIPRWVGDKPLVQKVPKTQKLPPFKDEDELRKIVTICHDLIWEKEGHDPAKAFDELTKLLFLKLYDEREVSNYYEFVVLANEQPIDTASKIRLLFDKAKSSGRYKDVFESKFTNSDKVTIELDDFTIHTCVQILQGFSLISTTENITGADIKGTIYEEMVGSTFRGELGQYFTPRTVAEFMVRMLDPTINDRILDPACGSGGFLLMVLRYINDKIKNEMPNLNENHRNQLLKDFAIRNIFGTDINDRVARVAKMNMIMHGDGHSGIFNVNGLYVRPEDNQYAYREIKENTFTKIFSNPPFAGYEKDHKILEKFELGLSGKGKARSVTKEILFIERIITLLQDGGTAALVLPQGIFSDKALKYVRSYIKKHCKIIALIALPIWAFRPSGTGVRGSLLFIEKCNNIPKDYDVFVKKVEHIGFDSTGKQDINDLNDILKEFRQSSRDNLIKFSELDNCMGYTNTGRIDPRFFIKQSREKLKVFNDSSFPLKKLEEICVFTNNFYNPKRTPDKEFLYIEINDVDIRTGKIRNRKIKGKDITQSTVIVEEGDLVISRRWPDRGAISIISKEYHNSLIVKEFSVLKVNESMVNKFYLYELLKTRHMRELMDIYSTGEMSHRISEEDLKKIKIPIPDKNTQDKIVEKYII